MLVSLQTLESKKFAWFTSQHIIPGCYRLQFNVYEFRDAQSNSTFISFRWICFGYVWHQLSIIMLWLPGNTKRRLVLSESQWTWLTWSGQSVKGSSKAFISNTSLCVHKGYSPPPPALRPALIIKDPSAVNEVNFCLTLLVWFWSRDHLCLFALLVWVTQINSRNLLLYVSRKL